MKQVPLCFVLMSRKNKKYYVALIRKITELMPLTSVCVVLDFERALLWSAVRACIPEASLHGFHWAQAVYHKVKKLGLQNVYMLINSL